MSAPSARPTGEGWMRLRRVLFLLLGLFDLMWAIAAFASDDDFAVDELLFGDLTLGASSSSSWARRSSPPRG